MEMKNESQMELETANMTKRASNACRYIANETIEEAESLTFHCF